MARRGETPRVGQIVYVLPLGHRTGAGRELTPEVVCKVGRKFFYVGDPGKTWEWTKYRLGTWEEACEYGEPDSRLYASPEEWEDEKEAVALARSIKKLFDGYGRCRLSLDQLRRMKAIADEVMNE